MDDQIQASINPGKRLLGHLFLYHPFMHPTPVSPHPQTAVFANK